VWRPISESIHSRILAGSAATVWEATQELKATHERVDEELASLVTLRNGANLWETLRLLNWVAAPSTQHSATRTQYGMRWIHTFGFADVESGKLSVGTDYPRKMGLLPTYRPEFIEARVAAKTDAVSNDVAEQLNSVFGPSIQAELADGGRSGSVQFVLPQVSKEDLELFAKARFAWFANMELRGWKPIGQCALKRWQSACRSRKSRQGSSLPMNFFRYVGKSCRFRLMSGFAAIHPRRWLRRKWNRRLALQIFLGGNPKRSVCAFHFSGRENAQIMANFSFDQIVALIERDWISRLSDRHPIHSS
jgi:hypothetical protein